MIDIQLGVCMINETLMAIVHDCFYAKSVCKKEYAIMRRPVKRIPRLSEWHRIKGNNQRGSEVEAIATRHVGFGALCEVGKHRLPGVLRSRENSWNPAKQKPEAIELGVPFRTVIVGYDDDWRELILSRKAADNDTFERFVTQYGVGSVVDGMVERTLTGGYLLRLEGDVEAYLASSTIPRVGGRTADAVSGIFEVCAGDHIRAVITSIDMDVRKIQVDVREYHEHCAAEIKRTIKTIRDNQMAQNVFASTPRMDTGEEGALPNGITSRKHKIFLVENHPGVLSPIKWALEQRGHNVVACPSAEEARKQLRSNTTIDVALVDLQLGEHSGEPLCHDIRKLFPAVRIYAFTGNPAVLSSEATDIDSPIIDGIVLKPVDLGTLIAYVEERSRPPSSNRIWALDQVLQSFVAHERLGVKQQADTGCNALLDSHLTEIVESIPGAKAAVLSFKVDTGEINCLRTVNISPEVFVKKSKTLAFTPLGDMLRDGTPMLRRVDPLSDNENNALADLMRLIDSMLIIGYPLHIESFRNPVGLFVFGPADVTYLEKRLVDSINSVATSMTGAIERSQIDIELIRHQRAMCVGSLILGMTHELRNSLQSLDSYTVVLRDKLLKEAPPHSEQPSECLDIVGHVRKEVVSLKDNLEMFLGIVRVEQAGQQRLSTMLSEVAESCQATARQDDILIDLQMPDSATLPVLPSIARQAFMNLLLNALQHTAAAGVRSTYVRISVKHATDDVGKRKSVEIRFSDNAWGMHAVDRERVFDIFFTTRKYGSGLGLYVTRLIIESMGGEVMVEDTVKFAGTTFLVRLPIQ